MTTDIDTPMTYHPGQASKLQSPDRYEIRVKGAEPTTTLAFGSLYAETSKQAKQLALVLASEARAVMRYTLRIGPDQDAALRFATVRLADSIPTPMMSPWKEERNWLKEPIEVFVTGELFQSAIGNLSLEAVMANARTPLAARSRFAMIQSVLATDPFVRKACSMGRQVSWRVQYGCWSGGPKSHAEASIIIASDTILLELAGPTTRAVLCLLLRANNYRLSSWRRYGSAVYFPDKPESGTMRLAQLVDSPTAWHHAGPAIAYLNRMGLTGLADEIKLQAVSAVR